MSRPTRDAIRAQFPSIAGGFAYMENAGGSQVPAIVADRIRDTMLTSYVNLGASYPASQTATQIVADAHDFVLRFMGGEGEGVVAFGASATILLRHLAEAIGRTIQPGDEIIVAQTGHEANIGPWLALEERGAAIVWWPFNPDLSSLAIEDLQKRLGPKTRLVCFPHTSNLLGDIVDVAEVTRMAHAAGAKVVVDGVAYAPHRPMRVAEWGVDWYVYSAYKVFGPHMAALFGRHDAFGGLVGPNHFFISPTNLPMKFEPGAQNYEGCAGLLALGDYLAFLAGEETTGTPSRDTLVQAMEYGAELERPLQSKLLEFLAQCENVRLCGPLASDDRRVCTISFVHRSLRSAEIVEHVHRHPFGIRNGHAYAYRLCEALGLDPADGVVRVSLAHTNSEDEVARLIDVLVPILGP